MEKLSSVPGITNGQLKAAQCCRLCLQASVIANVANGSGAALADWVLNPKIDSTLCCNARLLHPRQE